MVFRNEATEMRSADTKHGVQQLRVNAYCVLATRFSPPLLIRALSVPGHNLQLGWVVGARSRSRCERDEANGEGRARERERPKFSRKRGASARKSAGRPAGREVLIIWPVNITNLASDYRDSYVAATRACATHET